MKLTDHVDHLRTLIHNAFDKQFAKLGIGHDTSIDIEKLPPELHPRRLRFAELLASHKAEMGGDDKKGRAKAIDELTFTLFNRIAAVKVMEAATLFPPVISKEPEHGDRSFGHKAWLEARPDMRAEELEGIREYIIHTFNELGKTLPLYHKNYPYALLPDAVSLNEIIDAFNEVEKDPQVEENIWQSDDILGWLYESYNNARKKEFKESKKKVEFDKVSLQSQVYTPRWVVKFLVDNSLGKLYLEMYPDSEIKERYKIANAPKTAVRESKDLREIKLIDPSAGSGNFLLYAFDLFYDLYIDQIENYGVDDYDEDEIPRLIIENNLHGIDLDDRAIQLAQLGLYIKARKKKRNIGSLQYKVVSSDFFLPDYDEVRHIFEDRNNLDKNQQKLIAEIWGDLQYAYKFGSLIRLDEKIKAKLRTLELEQGGEQAKLFSDEELGIKPKARQLGLFTAMNIEQQKKFIAVFFKDLQKAVEQYARSKGNSFLASKTRDAIVFLELLSNKYDIASANPPYTDSSDFGPELKKFIESNYKKPYKFHTNLYATFIKRCYDFLGNEGKIAMVHPPTFMYIKTFEGVRKFIIEKTHINLFVEWGYLGMFNPSARVDSALYVLEKRNQESQNAVFIKLNHLYETKRYDALFNAYDQYLIGKSDEILYSIPQSKLKIIKSWPFIYWISDEFREKFGEGGLSREYKEICVGMQMPGNNERYFRFPWEVLKRKQYYRYSKGGSYNNWYGNDWLIIPKNLKHNLPEAALLRQIKIGVTSSRTSTKGASFRIKENTTFVDNNTINIFVDNEEEAFYLLGILNSKVNHYLFDCLNPTVHVQAGDLQRAPLPKRNDTSNKVITELSRCCVAIKKELSNFSLIEPLFSKSPYSLFPKSDTKLKTRSFFTYENYLLSQVFINEAIVNVHIFNLYDLSEADKNMVIAKEGESIGGLPVIPEARTAYLAEKEATKEFPLDNIHDFIESLPVKQFTPEEQQKIEAEFPALYQSNNNLEEFCIRHQINPINVWYWFKESNIIPKQRMNDLAMEFLADMIREILMEDEDGIISLVANAGEKILIDRIEDKFREKGFSTAQFSSFDSVLGRELNDYLNHHFFKALSDHLNLFMYLPKTPFIWHLSSGPAQGFACYIIIYKWSRDNLMRLKSVYLEHRERSLINRQSDLSNNQSAEAQNEKDKIYQQLKEIESFRQKIDDLLATGYNPILDDGVGKNIAPLQKRKMIPYEVLNAGQLKKYLNADW